MKFLPCDVMEALMEEDMERFRARKKAGMNFRRGHRSGMPSPSNSTFVSWARTGAGIHNILPPFHIL